MEKANISGKIIFIVDDDESVRDLIQTILERGGLKTRIFCEGQNASGQCTAEAGFKIKRSQVPVNDGVDD